MGEYYNPNYCTWPFQVAFVMCVVALIALACLA
jgi:hypothetical protein